MLCAALCCAGTRHVPQLLQAFLQGVWSLSQLRDFATVLPPFFRITVFSGFLGAMDFPAFLLPTFFCYNVAIRDGAAAKGAASFVPAGFLPQLVVAAALPFVITVGFYISLVGFLCGSCRAVDRLQRGCRGGSAALLTRCVRAMDCRHHRYLLRWRFKSTLRW